MCISTTLMEAHDKCLFREEVIYSTESDRHAPQLDEAMADTSLDILTDGPGAAQPEEAIAQVRAAFESMPELTLTSPHGHLRNCSILKTNQEVGRAGRKYITSEASTCSEAAKQPRCADRRLCLAGAAEPSDAGLQPAALLAGHPVGGRRRGGSPRVARAEPRPRGGANCTGARRQPRHVIHRVQ